MEKYQKLSRQSQKIKDPAFLASIREHVDPKTLRILPGLPRHVLQKVMDKWDKYGDDVRNCLYREIIPIRRCDACIMSEYLPPLSFVPLIYHDLPQTYTITKRNLRILDIMTFLGFPDSLLPYVPGSLEMVYRHTPYKLKFITDERFRYLCLAGVKDECYDLDSDMRVTDLLDCPRQTRDCRKDEILRHTKIECH